MMTMTVMMMKSGSFNRSYQVCTRKCGAQNQKLQPAETVTVTVTIIAVLTMHAWGQASQYRSTVAHEQNRTFMRESSFIQAN